MEDDIGRIADEKRKRTVLLRDNTTYCSDDMPESWKWQAEGSCLLTIVAAILLDMAASLKPQSQTQD